MRVSLNTRPAKRRSSRDGVALVITLSFLLIATALVIGFLIRSRSDVQASASYSSSVRAELLAAGAVDHVVANFLSEIADPGKSDPTPIGDLTWFEPIGEGQKFPSMLPFSVTRLPDPPTGLRNTLVKQSIPEKFHDGGSAPEIPASIVDSAADNGKPGSRPVTAERWNLPRLLQTADGTREEVFVDGQTPSWIYVKENGDATMGVPSRTSDFGIAGRYAYNVYDVGGLLNANVAGYDSAAQDDAGTKGAVTFADLTELPGGLQNQSLVNELVNWRAPYVSWNDSGDPLAPIQDSQYSVLDYLRMGTGVGWMKNPSLDSNGNQFFSRRDLLKYAQDKGFEDSLPFLTHFSVDLDAPTFSPPVNPTDSARSMLPIQAGITIIDGTTSGSLGNLRGKETEVNPPRYANDHAISVESSGGNVNLPVLRKRFPLSRLALVATDSGARATAKSSNDLTQRYFGLILEDDYTWRYKDADEDEGRIKRLSEIKDRDPNFFEILKSVIHVGSLGQYKQQSSAETRPGNRGVLTATEPFANRIDDHILRIGAAIIDQADVDNYPTRIKFADSQLGEIYGVEDLPYIHFMRFVAYCKPGSNTSASRGRVVLAQPSLWNPHNPARRNLESPTPDEFEVTATPINGGMQVLGTGSLANTSTGARLTTVQPENDPITFPWDPATGNFRQPQGLLSSTYPQGLSGPSHPVAVMENAPFFIGPRPYSNVPAIGFRVATSLNDSPITGTGGEIKYHGNPILFELKYKVGSGSFTYDRMWVSPEGVQPSDHRGGDLNHPYDMHRTFRSIFSARIDPNSADGGAVRSDAIYLKTDPRSHRFIWPSDMARFTGVSPGSIYRYTMAEGTGPGFYGGVYNNLMLDGQRTEERLPIHWVYNVHPSQGNTEGGLGQGVDREYRRDVGSLSVNRSDLTRTVFYRDPDRVTRRAMGGADVQKDEVQNILNNPGPMLGNRPDVLRVAAPGSPDEKVMPLESKAFQSPTVNPTLQEDYYGNRPVVLNRPFRSVGELAYTFRDVPWKNVDLAFPESGDTGLLDVFTVYEVGDSEAAEPLVAGKVNLNAAPLPVLRALVKGAAKALATGTQSTEVLGGYEEVVQRFKNYRALEGSVSNSPSGSNGPLRSLAEIVSRVYEGGNGTNAKFVGLRPEAFGGDGAYFDQALQERLSTAARALADVGTTRTWNLMIDVVTQAGRIAEGDGLEDFNTSSESRYWVFVSIDRFTGRVLAQSVERVIE